VVQNARDVIDHDPQLRYRGHWSRLPHPEIDECLYNVLPIRFSGIDIRPVVGAPCLGEHTVEVLHAAGLSLSEIDRLVDEEVLQ
jgi:crotonobetainyl-CoA:carnitine CoA-transferase CaiB-like acyl-CoA transferase